LIGIDANVLIAFELSAHEKHQAARATVGRLLEGSGRIAIAGQVLSEFIHVVTDARRFAAPVSMAEALAAAGDWVTDANTALVNPDTQAMLPCFQWMAIHQLGRKRILDTLLAATYHSAGVTELLTLNEADFTVFNVFRFIEVRS
jgi:predicted nucleic acid-binding protein